MPLHVGLFQPEQKEKSNSQSLGVEVTATTMMAYTPIELCGAGSRSSISYFRRESDKAIVGIALSTYHVDWPSFSLNLRNLGIPEMEADGNILCFAPDRPGISGEYHAPRCMIFQCEATRNTNNVSHR